MFHISHVFLYRLEGKDLVDEFPAHPWVAVAGGCHVLLFDPVSVAGLVEFRHAVLGPIQFRAAAPTSLDLVEGADESRRAGRGEYVARRSPADATLEEVEQPRGRL